MFRWHWLLMVSVAHYKIDKTTCMMHFITIIGNLMGFSIGERIFQKEGSNWGMVREYSKWGDWGIEGAQRGYRGGI
jgi:hypothetical protein